MSDETGSSGGSGRTGTGPVPGGGPDAGGAPIRVFLVDDHELVRRGVAELLAAEPGLEVVGQAGTAAEALERAEAARPDVALLDVRLPDGSGIEVCRELRSRMPGVGFLMLTSFAGDEALFGAIMAGASGYVLKDIRGSALVDAVRAVAAGGSLLDPTATGLVLSRLRAPAPAAGGPVRSGSGDRAVSKHAGNGARARGATGTAPGSEAFARPATAVDERIASLTSSERRILELIAEGLTNRQIGERLFLAEKTVKNYVTGILSKLEMQRRTQAAAFAVRHLPPES